MIWGSKSKRWDCQPIVSALSSCQISGPSEEVRGVSQINSGTSFGFCIGYCHTELTIQSSELTFSRKSWDRGDSTPPDQLVERTISSSLWRSLVDLVEFEVITQMKDVYGCPDCTDGGSEWIEITHLGVSKRVTFEYNAILEPISVLVDSLRSIRAEYLAELE